MPNKNKARAKDFPSHFAPAPIDPASDTVPEVSDVDIAFPCNYQKLLPKWDTLTEEERALSGPFCHAVSMLFYKGGRFEDHGIRVKPGIDPAKVMRYFRATAGDWGPKHEHKIGGIGHMLAKWCEVIPKDTVQHPAD